jgi:hypothetical protein
MSDEINIRLTRYVLADFARRNVFPMLREEHAVKEYGAYLAFNVTMDLVVAIKADVEEQYRAPISKVGRRHAYTAVIRQMDDIIRWPEIEKANRLYKAQQRQNFKEQAIDSSKLFLAFARSAIFIENGFRFDNETLAEFERIAGELENVLLDGRIVSCHDDEDEEPIASEVLACKTNAALQSFLLNVTSSRSLVENESQEGL